MIRIKRRFFVVGAPGGAPEGPPHLAELRFGTLGARFVPPMLFAGNSLRPGPPLAVRFQSALSGSMFFKPPALPEVYDFKLKK